MVAAVLVPAVVLGRSGVALPLPALESGAGTVTPGFVKAGWKRFGSAAAEGILRMLFGMPAAAWVMSARRRRFWTSAGDKTSLDGCVVVVVVRIMVSTR